MIHTIHTVQKLGVITKVFYYKKVNRPPLDYQFEAIKSTYDCLLWIQIVAILEGDNMIHASVLRVFRTYQSFS